MCERRGECGFRAFRSRADRGAAGRTVTGVTATTPRRLRLTTQALLLQLGVLVLVLVARLRLVAMLLGTELDRQYEQRALGIAHAVAADPELAEAVVSGPPDPDGPAQQLAEDVRRRTGALYVVVTDDRGIRYSHPTRARIGERVSTSPEEALSGHEVGAVENGTLGRSARGKVPRRDAQGHVVGEVSVGIDIDEIDQKTRALALTL